MVRGQRPKPAHLKLVTGNPGGRAIKAEPKSADLGPPPSWFTPAQAEVWHELITAAPDGVIKESDRVILELTVRLVIDVRTYPTVQAAVATQLRQCLGELGMSPSARARLSVGGEKKSNPFDED